MLVILFVVLIVIIIIALVFLYIFRMQIFGINPNSSKEILLEEGYGYYGDPIVSECTNKSGKCTETGVRIITQNCIPHPTTGRGCLMQNGFQTFQNKITTEPCLTTCRSSIWNIIESSGCTNKDLLEYGCVSSNITTGNNTLIKQCVPNDSNGINECTYDRLNNSPIPDGCNIANNGSTVVCNLGSIFNDIQSCSLDNPPICGDWLTMVDTKCGFPEHIIPSPYCYDFLDGSQITGIDNLFKFGFLPTPMHCTNNNCKPSNCTSDINEITNGMINEIPTIMCPLNYPINNETEVSNNPYCVARCFYFSQNVESFYNIYLQELIANFRILTIGDLFLTLNNTPCPVDNLNDNFLINKPKLGEKSIINNVMPPLSDCYANPNSNLVDTSCLMVNSNIKNNCSNEDVIINSALFLTFKPTKKIDSNVLYCNIISILNKDFIGTLEYDERGFIYWRQHKINTEITFLTNNSEFAITYNGINYTIEKPNYIQNNNNNNKCSCDNNQQIKNNNSELYCLTILNDIISLNNVNLDNIIDIDNFNDINELRSKRINGTGCNIFYSNILPKNYVEY